MTIQERVNPTSNSKDPEHTFTVSEFLEYINEVLTLRSYQVEGEILEFTDHKTGIYCTLKDEKETAIISCYISTWRYRQISKPIELGMKLRLTGAPSIYKPKGRLSFVVENYEYAGEGTLKLAYDALRRRLESEGLFGRKRQIKQCVKSVGVITSRTGAVIHDFRKNLDNRGFMLSLFHTKVEGLDAVSGVMSGLWYFNHSKKPDVIIIMRGGGSFEDLNVFNDEMLTRAVFTSNVPVICAIGHDKDIPLSCLAADFSPSTPTAAASLINATWERVVYESETLRLELIRHIESSLREARESVNKSESAIFLVLGHLRKLFDKTQGRITQTIIVYLERVRSLSGTLSDLKNRLQREIRNLVGAGRASLEFASSKLTAYDPQNALNLGYSIIRLRNGRVIRRISEVNRGEIIVSEVSDGFISSEVVESIKKNVND